MARRPLQQMIRKPALCCLLATTVFGCAWGYADQHPSETPADEGGESSPVVVSKESDDSEHANEPSEADPEAPTGGAAPCAVETFQVHYFNDETRATKTIDCEDRKVLKVHRSSIGVERRRTAQKAGLPRATWYLLVDPKGARTKFLSNDQLIRLSKEYDLQFLGRDKQRNLLIYEYQGDL